MSNKEEKTPKSKKTGKFFACALTGLAVGAAVYYLFATKEGKKTLQETLEGVNNFKDSFKKQIDEGLERASKYADKAKKEYEKVLVLAEDKGKDALVKAKHYKEEGKVLASKGLKYVEEASKEAQKYVTDASKEVQKQVDKV